MRGRNQLDAASGKQGLFDRPAVRGLTGLLLAACLVVAALVSLIAARWTPQRVSTCVRRPRAQGGTNRDRKDADEPEARSTFNDPVATILARL